MRNAKRDLTGAEKARLRTAADGLAELAQKMTQRFHGCPVMVAIMLDGGGIVSGVCCSDEARPQFETNLLKYVVSMADPGPKAKDGHRLVDLRGE